MVYLGRTDNQIKILGHRVELAEIEVVVREESGIDGVVAVGWPRTSSGASGVEVFLEDRSPNRPDLKERVARRLPSYMVPKRFHFVSQLPLNSNGKYDRKALIEHLEAL
jgi:acyl-coenzyme A synthetase/AMP-(fatty) acid ligase